MYSPEEMAAKIKECEEQNPGTPQERELQVKQQFRQRSLADRREYQAGVAVKLMAMHPELLEEIAICVAVRTFTLQPPNVPLFSVSLFAPLQLNVDREMDILNLNR